MSLLLSFTESAAENSVSTSQLMSPPSAVSRSNHTWIRGESGSLVSDDTNRDVSM
jgi:hypothetical protein